MKRPARTRMAAGSALVVGITALAPLGAATAHDSPRYVNGAPGAGDPYFPFAGNGGYDVRHYDLDITYTPPPVTDPPTPTGSLVGQFRGVATIDLVAKKDLNRFNLDLRGMDVRAVTVNGKRAAYWQVQDDAARKWELTIQPRPKLARGGTTGSSSRTAARPRDPPTSRTPSTAGSRRRTARWSSASPRGR